MVMKALNSIKAFICSEVLWHISPLNERTRGIKKLHGNCISQSPALWLCSSRSRVRSKGDWHQSNVQKLILINKRFLKLTVFNVYTSVLSDGLIHWWHKVDTIDTYLCITLRRKKRNFDGYELRIAKKYMSFNKPVFNLFKYSVSLTKPHYMTKKLSCYRIGLFVF